MRAVLDTNVLISPVISTGTPHEVVVAGFEGAYQIVVSVATLVEFRDTLVEFLDTLLKYPDRFHMETEAVQKEVETVRYFAEFVDPEEEISAVADDPDDDKFLEPPSRATSNISSPVTTFAHARVLSRDRDRHAEGVPYDP